MKRSIIICLVALTSACNNSDTKTTVTVTEPSKMNYPYTIDHPDYWEIGSKENTMIALSSLKKWEEGKMDESMTYFADSVYLEFDGLEKKMPKDTLKAMFAQTYATYKSVRVKMQDFESVISTDKKHEWVTMWYKQYSVYKDGKQDSVQIVNDVKIKDGKIIQLDEYKRKLQ